MVQFKFVLNEEFSVSELSVMSKYELVIYGASGFTGQFVTEYVARAAEEHQLSWAVAGRRSETRQLEGGRPEGPLRRGGKTWPLRFRWALLAKHSLSQIKCAS